MAMKLMRVPGLLIFVGILLTVQVRGDADMDKRHVSVLARTGQLPVQGKRYVAALAKNGELSSFMRPAWNKKLQRYMEENNAMIDEQKRYVGALAKTGDLRFSKYRDEKRDDVDSLIDELLTAEELRRLRREQLREELLREQEEQTEEEIGEEKRSLASLARSGNIPYVDGKRSIANLAKNGDFPWSGKRGGISSLMRSRFNQMKRSSSLENDLESIIDELSDEESEYAFRNADKRNLASFVKSGGLSALSYRNEKKDVYGDWGAEDGESKRNVQALARNRMSPFVEGKRYLGAFFASNGRPPYMSRDPNFKRNIGSAARTWGYADRYKMGKRDYDDDDFDADDYDGVDEVAKRYVAALLRQGRLPLGSESMPVQVSQNDDNSGQEDKDEEANVEEQKRHIGSIAAHSSFAMRKKKSVDPKEQDDESEKAQRDGATHADDNKTGNDIEKTHRAKRQAFFDAASSDEYPMPVMQNTVTSDYEDIVSNAAGDGPSARNKRYFGALARNGWLPTGYYRSASKRHIGALARLGWLPSFRSSRGFNRYGRDVRSPCKRSSGEGWGEDPWRETASDWILPQVSQPEFGEAPWPLSGANEDKRFLVLSALDNVLLRQMYPPRHH